MSIANELGKLIGELNQSKGGTLQFVGGTSDVGSFGMGNFAKVFYDTYFIPQMNYFRKAPNGGMSKPKPLLLRDKPRAVDRQALIKSRIPVWKENEIENNGYVNWDSFLDEQKIMKFDFTKPSPETQITISGTGIMVLEDPFTTKEKIQNNRLRIVKQGVDLTSLLLGMLGVCPKMNPYLKRLAGFELAKSMKKAGLDIVQEGSWILLKIPETVGGFFGNMIKKAIHEIKQVGKKIQKGLLDPIRDTMKAKLPSVWKTIVNFDEKAGVTKSLRKFSGTVIDVANKYGEKIVNMAVMAAATIAGGPQGSMAASMLLKVADNLSTKEKKALNDVVKVGGNLEKIDKEELKNLTVNLFGSIKNELISKKGSEGAADFQKIINMARDTVKETQVSDITAKETLAGIKMTIMPLTQYNSFVLGSILKSK